MTEEEWQDEVRRRDQIIDAVAKTFAVDKNTARRWIAEIGLSNVAA